MLASAREGQERMKLRIGTRNSDLARVQSNSVAMRLADAGHTTELVPITTAGDQSSAPSFGSIGPQGVFVREINQALLVGSIDLAVHSYKDLPTDEPAELVIAAVPARRDPADCLLIQSDRVDRAGGLLPLREGAQVGTASVRRQTWLRHLRPDLRPASLRGNVPTRIRRLQEGRYDAIVLAAAGLDRLRYGAASGGLAPDLAGITVVRLDPEQFVPAPAQGALALQCRRERHDVRDELAPLDDPPTRRAVDAERLLLAQLEGGCELAFGAFCDSYGTASILYAMLERGGRLWSESCRAAAPEPAAENMWQVLSASRTASGRVS